MDVRLDEVGEDKGREVLGREMVSHRTFVYARRRRGGTSEHVSNTCREQDFLNQLSKYQTC